MFGGVNQTNGRLALRSIIRIIGFGNRCTLFCSHRNVCSEPINCRGAVVIHISYGGIGCAHIRGRCMGAIHCVSEKGCLLAVIVW